MMIDFSHHVFRTARGLRLVPYNRLANEARQLLASSTLEGDGFGVALPADDSGRVIEVDTETALLFHVLEEAGPLPDHVLAILDEQTRHRLSDFILSGLLELQEGERFVSGAEAEGLMLNTGSGEDATSRLSHQAIARLFQYPVQSSLQVIQRLYSHNRIPNSNLWRRRLIDDTAFLGISSLDAAWQSSDSATGWHYLSRASQQPGHHRDRVHDNADGCRDEAKLYISVQPNDLPDALAITANILKHHDCDSFKVGAGVEGVLRPDKLVAYFPSLDALRRAAEELAPAISGLSPQGVPFTAAFTPDGLLSWGVDPDHNALGERKSWRQWVVERIAELHSEALAQMSMPGIQQKKQSPSEQSSNVIPSTGSPVEPESSSQLAIRWLLTRLQLDGIDTHTFKPRQTWIRENR